MLKKYELLILDYGGVYSFEYDPTSFNKIMQQVFGKIPSKSEMARISDVAKLLGSNRIDVETYVGRVAGILGVRPIPKVEDFQKASMSFTFPPSKVMVKLVRKVRKSGIKVSLISDLADFEAAEARSMGRYDEFDYISLSPEVGMTKHDSQVFTATLDHFNIPANKALFVDDVIGHTKSAESIGIDGLWVDKNALSSADDLSQKITQLLGL